jgi:hypothetical protein
MQGCGVSTPSAAAVAAATCGLLGLMHIPNGMMFIIGIMSIMFACGWLVVMVKFFGVTISTDGAAPNVHISCAVLITFIAMVRSLPIRGQCLDSLYRPGGYWQ